MSDQRPDDVEEEHPMAALRGLAARADGPPPEVVAAARAAFTWRTVDAELEQLAALGWDSLTADDRLAGVRGGGGQRQLTFEAAALTVELELDLEARPQLVGQLVPPQRAEVEVRRPGDVQTVAADELGRFAASGLRPGPVSLRCALADGTVVTTGWILA